MAPLSSAKKFFGFHSARFGEVLVTAALYPDVRALKSTCKIQNNN
jgi:hypothetical protein